jgi:GDP-4-dehydro-6-deoxy-D-mannose reductase
MNGRVKKRLLVTGLNGFVGKHLKLRLQQADAAWELVAPPGKYDLTQPETLAAWCASRPDAVLHLAGQTFVPESFRYPHHTFDVNLLGTLNLLQALKAGGFDGTFLYVSSGDIYGQVDETNLPIREDLLPKPRNPYAVSKYSAETLCLQWSYVEPWRVLVARPFNHIGAGQSDSFVISSLARQLVQIARGKQEPLVRVGEVDVTRDFLDVRDVVEAYLYLLEHGRTSEVYNVCSGHELRIRDLILQLANLAGAEVELTEDPERFRPSEQRRVVGSAEKLQAETNWKPCISITETLQSVLADWQEREK